MPMVLATKEFPSSPYWQAIYHAYKVPQKDLVTRLQEEIDWALESRQNAHIYASSLVLRLKQKSSSSLSFESFLKSYGLSSKEGIALLCLAEALLRIPDSSTKRRFIQDQLTKTNWNQESSENLLVKLSSLGLSFGKHLVSAEAGEKTVLSKIGSIFKKFSEPVIEKVMTQAIKLLGNHFVLSETIDGGLKKLSPSYAYSFDCLGEAAKTQLDADTFYKNYEKALSCLEKVEAKTPHQKPSLSIKLSALFPRYEFLQRERILTELYQKVYSLVLTAKNKGIALTIDAEESNRLTLSLEIVEKLALEEDLKDYQGLGLAVQAYQKRALDVLKFLNDLSKRSQKRFNIRLVKGAYWDSEIKRAQEGGFDDYPVFVDKALTDLNYLTCAQYLFNHEESFYPQFATHNAYTVATILELGKKKEFEFQKLHGMGDHLYEELLKDHQNQLCRVYAPVGPHKELLAYLVRRLLENGSNSSFVNQLLDSSCCVDALVQDPLTRVESTLCLNDFEKLQKPCDLYAPNRPNSKGYDLSDVYTLKEFDLSSNPPVFEDVRVIEANNALELVTRSLKAFQEYRFSEVDLRVKCLHELAKLLEKETKTLIYLLQTEGKKTLQDALSEVREAIDFCYYYAAQASEKFSHPITLKSPTGEKNLLSYHPRGVFLAISPWNFPLAIFTGQIVAALVSGNTVIAKPAYQTPKIAAFVISLLHKSGFSPFVVALAHGSGATVGQALLEHPKIAGVVFTGSTQTAFHIQKTLSQKEGPLIPFIAETGGLNTMIIDSSALLEQAVTDVITSSFQSVGQRCSALRIVYVQEEIFNPFCEMLKGAMKELRVGDPLDFSTDVGPVIDEEAQQKLEAYCQQLNDHGTLLAKCEVDQNDTFVAPQAWILKDDSYVTQEHFGPILHCVPYKSGELLKTLDSINQKGYGLTMGLHTRLSSTMELVKKHACVGNLYINRSMIGAVVGVQPFGGEGLSGTGFKAGGPNYLLKFIHERVSSHDTTASGGNVELMTTL